MDTNAVLFAFSLTLFAGLSTGIGSGISLIAKRTNTGFLTLSLGFSAGVMIYVSFIEIFPKAQEAGRGNRNMAYSDCVFWWNGTNCAH
jgi:ZIP family zinc transporter